MLEARTAVVTGGLQGIGLAIAAELARQGAQVAVGARRGGDGGIARNALKAIDGHATAHPLDVCSAQSIDTFMSSVNEAYGAPDILVNAAGISVHHPVDGHSDDDWNATIDTNLSGPFRMIRACLPAMKANGWGRIVNIASTAARTAQATHPAYCASKAGLVGLTRAVALEGGPHGITCVAVSPTWVETEMLHASSREMAARSGRTVESELEAIASSNPQGRLVQPRDVAALVAFCCSDAAGAITMEDIQVNAGALW